MERPCSRETHDGGFNGHSHGDWAEQRRSGPCSKELPELLSTHPKVPHVTYMKAQQKNLFALLVMNSFKLQKKEENLYFKMSTFSFFFPPKHCIVKVNPNCTLHLLHQHSTLQHRIGGNDGCLGHLAHVDHPMRRGRLSRNRNGAAQKPQEQTKNRKVVNIRQFAYPLSPSKYNYTQNHSCNQLERKNGFEWKYKAKVTF